ncbi:Protein THEM6 [Varanus komodoensis]|uniref:Protein THEM6 n=1 Tax=Varanus komodoensis TaxID=61221 RepID=A0A8D2LRC8_VARKO|nr:protein THEM6 [Varanus komodoensis]KAF7237205.1 Protein THEM6 [Varanus komodoensis]
MLAVLLGAAAAFFALLDGWHLLRMGLAALRAGLVRPAPRALLQEHRFESRVLPADLDLLLHMSNARYPREADLARCAHLARCGLLGAVRALGARLVLAASCCRYRRPLRLPERFAVRSRLLGWDARAFVAEQRFVRARDGFVCAVLLARLHVEGASPAQAVARLCGRQVESPELPEEVQHWMKYNEASSRKLRAESGLQTESKSQ